MMKNWTESDLECSDHDQRLASILSGQEALTTTIALANTYFWIGLNDIENEDVFVWVDGSPFVSINWAFGYPSGGVTANCVGVVNGFASDEECASLLQYHFCSSTGE